MFINIYTTKNNFEFEFTFFKKQEQNQQKIISNRKTQRLNKKNVRIKINLGPRSQSILFTNEWKINNKTSNYIQRQQVLTSNSEFLNHKSTLKLKRTKIYASSIDSSRYTITVWTVSFEWETIIICYQR